MTTWADRRREVASRLRAAGVESADSEARWLVEQASGLSAQEWAAGESTSPSKLAEASLETMTTRRLAGEPLQYVLGEWTFRELDLMLDPRVLIPRPETEVVAEIAIGEAVRLGARRGRRRPGTIGSGTDLVLIDLGTGSGAIGLSLAAELTGVVVWATDVSADCLAVARANAAGNGLTVKLGLGSWFDALPNSLRGVVDLVVANPPYVTAADYETLDAVVRDHEPRGALVADADGASDLSTILDGARPWLRPGGAVVLELDSRQADQLTAEATDLGYVDIKIHPDLTRRPRVMVALTPSR